MKYTHKQPGVTLIGVIISSVILGFSFIAFMNLQAALVQFVSKSNDEVLAQSLANEALELVRSVRDANYTESEAWDTHFPASGNSAFYAVDQDLNVNNPTSGIPGEEWQSTSCTELNLLSTCSLSRDTSNFFVLSGNNNEKFYRFIELNRPTSAGLDRIEVTVTVVVNYPNSSNKVYRSYTELYDTF
jgi:Tfp pilus assembly protein PilV